MTGKPDASYLDSPGGISGDPTSLGQEFHPGMTLEMFGFQIQYHPIFYSGRDTRPPVERYEEIRIF